MSSTPCDPVLLRSEAAYKVGYMRRRWDLTGSVSIMRRFFGTILGRCYGL